MSLYSSFVTHSEKMLNKTSARTQPCLVLPMLLMTFLLQLSPLFSALRWVHRGILAGDLQKWHWQVDGAWSPYCFHRWTYHPCVYILWQNFPFHRWGISSCCHTRVMNWRIALESRNPPSFRSSAGIQSGLGHTHTHTRVKTFIFSLSVTFVLVQQRHSQNLFSSRLFITLFNTDSFKAA